MNQETILVNTQQQKSHVHAMCCHLIRLLDIFISFLGLVGVLILWLVGKNHSTFVDYHGRQSLNFYLSLFLYGVVLAVVCFCLAAIPFIAVGIGALLVIILSLLLPFLLLFTLLSITKKGSLKKTFKAYIYIICGTLIAAIMMILGPLAAALIGGIGLFVLLLLNVVFTVIASIKAYNGEYYQYPFTIYFL